jgi:pimeloyl-ACP methyl ester carboxylesterase
MHKITSLMGYSLSTVVFAASLSVVGMEKAIASTFSIKAIASQIAKKTDVPILLPSEDIVEKYKFDNNETIYARVYTKSQYDEYDYTVSFHKHPGGGNATLRFSIKAKKGGNINRTSPDEKATFKNIQLFNGSNALLIQQCGAACWSWLQWKSNGVLYEVWSKTRTPETAIAIANSAIKTSPRQFNTAFNTTDKSCITWSRYAKDLPSEGGRGGQWWKYGQFPSKFQQGCVVLDDGNAIDSAWILQSGLDIKPYSQLSRQSYQKLPIPTNSNALDRLVNQGKAVLVTWLTPTNGSLQYLRSIPKDRPFLRDDGMTCLNTVCLKSAALSHRELSQILSPGIAKSPQPSSPSNQTARTPAASTPSSCPAGQFEAQVLPNPEYGNQSPSYAFLETAGPNRNGRRSDGTKIAADTRCIFFREISNPSDPKQTLVVIHGWNSDSSSPDLQALAKAIAQKNPGDRVLMFDWGEASFNQGGFQIPGIGQSVRGVYYSATWIRPVAEVVVKQLKQKYGINEKKARSSLKLVGHSLGSLMSAEIGGIYRDGVNSITALDPASESTSQGDVWSILGGYDVDGRTPAYQINEGNPGRSLNQKNVDRPKCFGKGESPAVKESKCDAKRRVAGFSRAFVGKTSSAGNQGFAASADESFQMDFGVRLVKPGSEHGDVIKVFTNMISTQKFGGFLGLSDLTDHSKIQKGSDGHSGIIKVDNLTAKEIVLEHTLEGGVSIQPDGKVYSRPLLSRVSDYKPLIQIGTVQTIFNTK